MICCIKPFTPAQPASLLAASRRSTMPPAISSAPPTRDGNVHQYTYDTAGRKISDTVITLGAGVNGSVRRIDTAYNSQGLVYLQTSYADTAGTQIVNQVEDHMGLVSHVEFTHGIKPSYLKMLT